MKINLATAVHCGVLFHGGTCLTEALVIIGIVNEPGSPKDSGLAGFRHFSQCLGTYVSLLTHSRPTFS